ncbi:hypothetical protein VL15_35000 [Burkholderia cepacia]|uniref:Uncharacterized protein n=1 Tax=Burkholderia cepacia TaxID=292 RepID=A0A0J5WC96_BURCE|nr:hypothetical protein [Burkholderia cepacia]KML46649.1 hypothetical protein VL15_35000 [Burkholderia cepacia]
MIRANYRGHDLGQRAEVDALAGAYDFDALHNRQAASMASAERSQEVNGLLSFDEFELRKRHDAIQFDE